MLSGYRRWRNRASRASTSISTRDTFDRLPRNPALSGSPRNEANDATIPRTGLSQFRRIRIARPNTDRDVHLRADVAFLLRHTHPGRFRVARLGRVPIPAPRPPAPVLASHPTTQQPSE